MYHDCLPNENSWIALSTDPNFNNFIRVRGVATDDWAPHLSLVALENLSATPTTKLETFQKIFVMLLKALRAWRLSIDKY